MWVLNRKLKIMISSPRTARLNLLSSAFVFSLENIQRGGQTNQQTLRVLYMKISLPKPNELLKLETVNVK